MLASGAFAVFSSLLLFFCHPFHLMDNSGKKSELHLVHVVRKSDKQIYSIVWTCLARILNSFFCHILLLSIFLFFSLLFSINQLLLLCAQTSPTLLQTMTTFQYRDTGFHLKLKTSCISKRSVCLQIICTKALSHSNLIQLFN